MLPLWDVFRGEQAAESIRCLSLEQPGTGGTTAVSAGGGDAEVTSRGRAGPGAEHRHVALLGFQINAIHTQAEGREVKSAGL